MCPIILISLNIHIYLVFFQKKVIFSLGRDDHEALLDLTGVIFFYHHVSLLHRNSVTLKMNKNTF